MSPRKAATPRTRGKLIDMGAPGEVSLRELQDIYARDQSEAEFQREVVRVAKGYGWRYWHDRVAWKSQPGWPDLWLFYDDAADEARDITVIAELKRIGGKLSPAQVDWMGVWKRRCDRMPAVMRGPFVWMPTRECWDEIHEVLSFGEYRP